MNEKIANANGIELAYQAFGDRSDPALLLVMGLGAQLIHWQEEFCELLAARGFFVIRFDNRDVGHSTKFDDAPVPDLMALAGGDASEAHYTLDDMADDAVGLLDHLGIDAAHVAGASMGGMIAQTLAIRHPDRVLSICSIMSTTGNREVGQARPEALSVLMTPVPQDREGYIEFHVKAFKAIGSPGFPFDEEFLRWRGGATYDRSVFPDGFRRQLAAIIASGDRTEALGRVSTPAVVIHGREDPLITVSGGEATARAMPGAKLVVIPGMGHDLPRGAWPQIIDEIAENAARAQSDSLGVGGDRARSAI
jgi:pimeloyl-ACP methyl ester carboxylesterase